MSTNSTPNGTLNTRTLDKSAPKSLSNLFAPAKTDFCQRCGDRVYAMEKIGPVNEVVFHSGCFKCSVCQQKLTLRTYYTNSTDVNDTEVYCSKHAPKDVTRGLDASAMGIRSALNAPKSDRQRSDQVKLPGTAPNVGPDAMFIANPVQQSRYRKHKHMTYSKHHFPAFLVSTLIIRVMKVSKYKYINDIPRLGYEEYDITSMDFMDL